MNERRCAYGPCGNHFTPSTPGQKTCSFRCARAIVPKVIDDDEIPNPTREARRAKGWLPKPVAKNDPRIEARNRARRIADALDELKKTNEARLRN